MSDDYALPIGMCAQIACLLDVAAHKPGNVSFDNSFADMNCVDMLLSAAAIAPVMERAHLCSVGETILESIRATRLVTRVNTNLGIVLLLAPLASVTESCNIRRSLARVLLQLTVRDAQLAYEAIRLAKPGGLGSVEQQDVAGDPSVTLREAMALAADRDMIARQYVNDYEQVFEAVELLREEMAATPCDLRVAITRVFLRFLALHPDSLIARKDGLEAAAEHSRLARQILDEHGDSMRIAGSIELERKNPGTTADIVVASLFVVLRTGMIRLPLDTPFRTDL